MKKHFGPMQITVYADGYVHASLTACGLLESADSEDDCDLAATVSYNPVEVTCERCRRSPHLKTAAADFDKTGAPRLPSLPDIVPRMRNLVYKRGGRYDTEKNNRLRQFLGLTLLSPDPDAQAALKAFEDEKRADYAQRRARWFQSRE